MNRHVTHFRAVSHAGDKLPKFPLTELIELPFKMSISKFIKSSAPPTLLARGHLSTNLMLKHGTSSEKTTQSDSHSCPTFGVGSLQWNQWGEISTLPPKLSKHISSSQFRNGAILYKWPFWATISLCPNERCLNNSEKHYEVKIDCWYSIFTPACLLRICVCPQIAWWLSCVYVWVCMCVWRQDLSGGLFVIFILTGTSVLSERGGIVSENRCCCDVAWHLLFIWIN